MRGRLLSSILTLIISVRVSGASLNVANELSNNIFYSVKKVSYFAAFALFSDAPTVSSHKTHYRPGLLLSLSFILDTLLPSRICTVEWRAAARVGESD